MLGKIKYSYIPKEKSTDAILSSLAYAIKASNALDYKIIDSVASGARIYPEEVKDYVIRCHHEELKAQIRKEAEAGIEIIILNAFCLDLDEIRNDFCELVEEYDIMLCVNILTDLEKGSNISIVIETDIKDLDEEEWVVVRQEILDSLDAVKDGKTTANNKKDDLSGLLEIFGLKDLYKNNYKDDDEDELIFDDEEVDIKEQYSHCIKDSEMSISLTTSNDILIETDDDFVLVPKKQVSFLVSTLQKLVK